jgi:Na+/H+-dicarboxylate symporter
MGRTMMNVVGNCLATAVVASSEGELIDAREPVLSPVNAGDR